MRILFTILIVVLGIIHLGIMCLEMFAKPATQASAFNMSYDFVERPEAQTALKNQGIYNGGLGILLLLSLALPAGSTAVTVQLALIAFVALVGTYGGFTATKNIFLIQVLPAVIAFIVGLLTF